MDRITAQLALEAADTRYKAAWNAREVARKVFREAPLTDESAQAYSAVQLAFKRALADWEGAAAAFQAACEAEGWDPDAPAEVEEPEQLSLGPCF